ncbi:P-loop containing nucleoside triphosphate hydrolase protein [Entophlyctis helioformis]|nr:P-loop containing nucleoside triphosphate hydrolase protein [Entophlyctis helioformis]
MDAFSAVHPLSVAVAGLGVAISSPPRKTAKTAKTANAAKAPPAFQALQAVSFNASCGQVVAILGSSGSGKTTLLHALAGRTHNAKIDGQILFDGKSPKPFFANGSVGYVQQHDHLMPYLTVRETLRYCAELRLPSAMPVAEKFNLVEEVILELGLKECADTIIGDDWRKGISGGEKRRVSVGCQLLLNPSIIFMDEPTTGLDAFTSFNLMETLVNLSRRGRTIFVSIHQPRSDIFKLFDSIILLSKGRTVYAGEGGQRALSYFANLGFPVPTDVNPADHIIDITSIDNRDPVVERRTRGTVDRLVAEWDAIVAAGKDKDFACPPRADIALIRKKSADLLALQANPQREAAKPDSAVADQTVLVASSPTDGPQQSAAVARISGAGFVAQCTILTRRAWKNLLRDNLSLWGNLFEVIAVGLIFGAIFFQLSDSLPGVLSRRAALYIVASMQTYLMLIFVIYKLCNDMKVFDRERADYMYGVVPYLFGQFMSQLPFNLLFPLIYSTFMYFMMGLRQDDLGIHYTRFATANVLGHLVVVAFSQFCVAFARDFPTSSLIANSLFTFFSFSTGFFIQLDSIPVYLRWISNVSFLSYQYRLMASNEFSNNQYACADVGAPCQGNSILASLAIGVDDYTVPIVSLVVIFSVFMIMAALVLIFVKVELNKHAGAVKSTIKVANGKSAVPLEEGNADADLDGATKNSSKVPPVNVRVSSIRLELTTRSINPMASGSTKSKVLLDSITADFPANCLTIIMGGSGTGKSTLLSVLTARKLRVSSFSSLKQTGQVLFNNQEETNPARIASVCSFVRQSDDHLLPALTCRETLYFSARLRLPSDWTRQQKEDRAEEVLTVLGLRHCADTIVGDEQVKGLSGGEKRRLSIGVQMLTDPSVLVIDEPTSGLDAFTAHHIMVTLKRIAESGRTIICSIHQPRSDIFGMFDNIVLLTRGGRVGYSGPARSIIPHFAAIGHKLPELTNPADFVLDISSVDLRNPEAEQKSKAQVDAIVSYWAQHGANSPVIRDLEAGSVQAASPAALDTSNILLRKMAPFSIAFPVLAARSFINAKRQPNIVFARIAQVVSLGIIHCLYFARQGNSQVRCRTTISTLFIGLLNCVAMFPAERNILFSEHSDRAYGVEPFFVAYNLIELSVFCLTNLGESIGIAFCSIVDHIGFSVSLTNSVLGIFVAMSGILSAGMPIFLDRINRISPIAYFARLMTVNEFDPSTSFTCTPQDIQTGNCLYRTGPDVLRLLTSSSNVFSFDGSQTTLYIIVGCVLTVVYRLVAYAVLRWRAAA